MVMAREDHNARLGFLAGGIGERQDRGGGRCRRGAGRAAQQLLLDDAGPHAGEGRRAVPEGVADAVGADGRERADAQRPV